jgi:hypothetical protein
MLSIESRIGLFKSQPKDSPVSMSGVSDCQEIATVTSIAVAAASIKVAAMAITPDFAIPAIAAIDSVLENHHSHYHYHRHYKYHFHYHQNHHHHHLCCYYYHYNSQHITQQLHILLPAIRLHRI